ncbi:MAG: DUF2169 domain-containing protein [Comamonadaceae bacterium]|nr:MAG: DUF2169 domain-containing protein [Comamonadaceae bacterium]
MKVIKPDTLALLHRQMRLRGTDVLSLGLVAYFPLAQPSLGALQPEAALWQGLPQWPGSTGVLDEGFPKAQAEYMVYGTACAPGGQPVNRLVVGARVGPQVKQLLVHGPRRWSMVGTPTAAQPFVRMPVTPQNAFGGADDARNPLGQGSQPVAQPDGTQVRMLPPVEDPHHPLAFADDRPAPAGFWGVDSSAAARLRELGAMDVQWLRSTWPALPEGTRDGYFQSAPPDQRQPGFWVGDEPVELTHWSAQSPQINSRLPGLRARCFVQRQRRSGDTEFIEVRTHAETLWLLPDLGCAALLYRAALEVEDADARDVLALVADWELMGDAPRPEQHYRDQLPQAGATAAPAPQMPAAVAAQGAAAEGAGALPALSALSSAALPAAAPAVAAARPAVALDPQLVEMQQVTARLDAQTDRLLAELGISRDTLMQRIEPAPAPRVSLADLEAMTARIDARRQKFMAERGLTQADLDAFTRQTQQPPPPMPTEQDLLARTQKLWDQKEAVQRGQGFTDAQLAEFLKQSGAGEEAVALALQPRPDFAALKAALAALPVLPPPKAPSAALPPAPELPPQPDVQAPQPWTRERVVAHHAQQQSLAGQDLSGLDLSGLPLRGVDLRGALLQGTNFGNADLQQAVLTGVRAAGAVFAQAQLAQGVLDAGDFARADFSGARLGGASCQRTDFTGSRMDGLQARGSQATGANFTDCALAQADFEGATLVAACFDLARVAGSRFVGAACARSGWERTQAQGADFSHADLSGMRAGSQADFSDALMPGVRLDQANLSGVTLQGAVLNGASLQGADLSGVQARKLRMVGVDARGANLSLADLTQADGRGGNFMGASLRRAQLDECLLDLSNLHGSDLEGSTIGRAQARDIVASATLMGVAGRAELQP